MIQVFKNSVRPTKRDIEWKFKSVQFSLDTATPGTTTVIPPKRVRRNSKTSNSPPLDTTILKTNSKPRTNSPSSPDTPISPESSPKRITNRQQQSPPQGTENHRLSIKASCSSRLEDTYERMFIVLYGKEYNERIAKQRIRSQKQTKIRLSIPISELIE